MRRQDDSCDLVVRVVDAAEAHMVRVEQPPQPDPIGLRGVITLKKTRDSSCIDATTSVRVAGKSEADWLFRSCWPINDQSSAFRSQPECHTSLERFDT